MVSLDRKISLWRLEQEDQEEGVGDEEEGVGDQEEGVGDEEEGVGDQEKKVRLALVKVVNTLDNKVSILH